MPIIYSNPAKKIAKKSTKSKTTEDIVKAAKGASVGGKRDKVKAAQMKILSLDATLARFHGLSDEALERMIVPDELKAERHTYRLDEGQREARLVLMHRMIVRKMTVAHICNVLSISVPMYYKLRNQLDERMRLDINKVDVPAFIGDSLAFYDEVRGMALTLSSSPMIKDPRIRLTAMSVALKAEADKNLFLTQAGVYSQPVIEHVIRGLISTGNLPNPIDGTAQKMSQAEQINTELASLLRTHALALKQAGVASSVESNVQDVLDENDNAITGADNDSL